MARGAVGTIWSPPAVAEMMVRLSWLRGSEGEKERDKEAEEEGGERERKKKWARVKEKMKKNKK